MLVGCLLVFMSESAISLLTRIVGAVFFLPALVSVVNLYVSRKDAAMLPKVLISVIDIGSMAFGIWIMVAPVTFQSVFVKLLAVILLVYAVYQVVMLVSAHKHITVPATLYVTPLLLVIAAVVLLSVSFEKTYTMSIVFGICAIVSGLSDLLISLKLKNSSQHRAVEIRRVYSSSSKNDRIACRHAGSDPAIIS